MGHIGYKKYRNEIEMLQARIQQLASNLSKHSKILTPQQNEGADYWLGNASRTLGHALDLLPEVE